MRTIRENNYAANLQFISDQQLESMEGEYNFTNPYKRLQIAGTKIIDYCQSYLPRLRHYEQLNTIRTRIYAYTRNGAQSNSQVIASMTQELEKLTNTHISICLPRELNEEIITCLIDMYRLTKLEYLDQRLGIDRQSLIKKEVGRRNKMFDRGNYINNCVVMLINQKIITLIESFTMTEDEIIKLAHIQKYKTFNCNDCQGRINFDKIYRDTEKKTVYLDHGNLRGLSRRYTGRGASTDILKYPEFPFAFSITSNWCPCRVFDIVIE